MSNFLGHIVGQGFRTPSEIKVQAVLEFLTPRTKTQIRAFLGIAGYYQKYINLFSVIAAPLTDALKGRAKKGEIKWTTECENAFRELKGKLIDKPPCTRQILNENSLFKRTLRTQVSLFPSEGVYYDHREEITDFAQSIPGLQECDEEDVETWMACDAEGCGF
ncbi:retrovirus-related Pol polyprotein from transposon 17.6 [Trichonephila clavipes]|nr:retrovirus-related Pol polyprotein from transposon 17.6 [Trichonephila clavipes]